MKDTTDNRIKRYGVIARQDGLYYVGQKEGTKNREVFWTKRVEDAEHFEIGSKLSVDLKKLKDKKKKVTNYLRIALPKSLALVIQVKEVTIANRTIRATSVLEDLADLKRETGENSV